MRRENDENVNSVKNYMLNKDIPLNLEEEREIMKKINVLFDELVKDPAYEQYPSIDAPSFWEVIRSTYRSGFDINLNNLAESLPGYMFDLKDPNIDGTLNLRNFTDKPKFADEILKEIKRVKESLIGYEPASKRIQFMYRPPEDRHNTLPKQRQSMTDKLYETVSGRREELETRRFLRASPFYPSTSNSQHYVPPASPPIDYEKYGLREKLKIIKKYLTDEDIQRLSGNGYYIDYKDILAYDYEAVFGHLSMSYDKHQRERASILKSRFYAAIDYLLTNVIGNRSAFFKDRSARANLRDANELDWLYYKNRSFFASYGSRRKNEAFDFYWKLVNSHIDSSSTPLQTHLKYMRYARQAVQRILEEQNRFGFDTMHEMLSEMSKASLLPDTFPKSRPWQYTPEERKLFAKGAAEKKTTAARRKQIYDVVQALINELIEAELKETSHTEYDEDDYFSNEENENYLPDEKLPAAGADEEVDEETDEDNEDFLPDEKLPAAGADEEPDEDDDDLTRLTIDAYENYEDDYLSHPANPRAAMAVPRAAMANPRAAMANPRAAMANPRTAMANPHDAMANTRAPRWPRDSFSSSYSNEYVPEALHPPRARRNTLDEDKDIDESDDESTPHMNRGPIDRRGPIGRRARRSSSWTDE
jgi:hypothetical protein